MTESWRQASIAALIVLGNALVAVSARAANDDSAVVIDTEGSVVLLGGSVAPSRPAPENLVAAGGRIVIDQPVGASAALAGGSIDVRAPVGSRLRAAGGSVSVESRVGGGASLVGGEVRVAREAAIEGFAHIVSGTVVIDGRIGGPLKVSGDRITINGEIAGDVKAAAEEIVLGPAAKIGGSLQYASAKELVKGEGAVIGGEVTRKQPGAHDTDEDMPRIKKSGHGIVGTIVSFIALLGCGALFLAIAPIFSVETPDRIKSTPWKALGVGLLSAIGVPIVAILFMLTIVGIPVGVMLFMLYPIALLFGFVVGTLFVGNAGASLLKRPPPPTIAAAIGYFAIALAVVMLVTKLPSVGGLLLAVLILLGVGAFEVELYRRMKGGAGVARAAMAR